MNRSLILSNISQATLAQLRKAAEAILKHAYAPYSHFPVGAVLLTESGRIFQGCNIENAAYPSGLCAEAVAIDQICQPWPDAYPGSLHRLQRALPGPRPCGTCRQRLNGFAAPSMWVYTSTLAGSPQRMAFSELLPNSFGAADLQEIGV